MEQTIEKITKENTVPKLCLHSCCAPCSTYVIQYLSEHFLLTVFYYNPNIDDKDEYNKRAQEQQRLIEQIPTKYPVKFVQGNYDVKLFHQMAKPLAMCKEGGARCEACYKLRLEETARYAKSNNFDYFTTTLSISPMKNAEKLNEIGDMLAKKYEVPYLNSDFKKKDGYKASVGLSEIYGLYRQAYCGCSYSKAEALSSSEK
ncbi:MAG: epoxyqueuosine reductase QueH [Cellulosilyticaceae bacterium]